MVESARKAAVWLLSSEIVPDDDLQTIQKDLKTLFSPVMIFDNAQNCIDYLEQTPTYQGLLIVSEFNGEQIIPTVLHKKILSIYILCLNQMHQPKWTVAYPSLRFIFVARTSLYDRIRKDVDEKNSGIAFDVLDTSTSSDKDKNKQELIFMYVLLLKHVLTEMSYSDDDFEKMIEFFMKRYQDRPKQLEKIKNFRRNYRTTLALTCYTKYEFLYTTLNAALRTCDLDVMYMMGTFIKDLHQQLVFCHQNDRQSQPLTVYRGVVIPRTIFEKKLEGKEGRLLSINEFFSTSLDTEVARSFASVDRSVNDHVGILLHIDVNPSSSAHAVYTDLRPFTVFRDEAEYLFSMGIVFRIRSIESIDHKSQMVNVYLSATDDHDEDLTKMTNYYRSLLGPPNLYSLCEVLLEMGEFEKVIQICQTISSKVDDNVDRLRFYMNLGFAYGGMGHTQQAIQAFQDGMKFRDEFYVSTETKIIRSIIETCLIMVRGDDDDIQTSLELIIDRALQEPESSRTTDFDVAIRFSKVMIMMRKHRFVDAKTEIEKTLTITHEHFPLMHPMVDYLRQCLCVCHFMTGDLTQARSSLPEQTVVLPDHLFGKQALLLRQLCDLPSGIDEKLFTSQRPIDLILTAYIYYKERKIDQALAKINQYHSIGGFDNQSMGAAHLIKGHCLIQKKNFIEAAESFQKMKHFYSLCSMKSIQNCRDFISHTAKVFFIEQDDPDAALSTLEICRMFDNPQDQNDRTSQKALADELRIRVHIHGRRGDFEQALSAEKELLKLQLKYLQEDDLELATTYERIARLLCETGNESDALINYQKALIIKEKSLPSNDPLIIDIWYQIGRLKSPRVPHNKAVTIIQDNKQILLNSSPIDHSRVARLDHYIADIFSVHGEFVDAIIHYQYALDVYTQRSPVSDDNGMEFIAIGLEKIYRSQKGNLQAIVTLQKALQTFSILPEMNPKILSSIYQSLGIFHFGADRLDEALASFKECLQIRINSYPENHWNIGKTYFYLGRTLIGQKKYFDANNHLNIAFNIQHQYVRTTNREFIETCKNLKILKDKYESDLERCKSIEDANGSLQMAITFYEEKSFYSAIPCAQKALQICLSYLPETTSFVIDSWYMLGNIYMHMEQYENALSAYEEVLELQFNVSPNENLDKATTYKMMATIYCIIRRCDAALEKIEKCWQIQRLILPQNDPELKNTEQLYHSYLYLFQLMNKQKIADYDG